MSKDDSIIFVDKDKKNNDPHLEPTAVWKILVVDDDISTHKSTTIIFKNKIIEHGKIELLHAYSASQAKMLLTNHEDIAVILLDVIMENEHAGLDFIQHVRCEKKLKAPRIILRTGQPGQAPESKVFERYDIHDYKEKSELTSTKLKNSVYSAVRAYRDISNEILQHQNQTQLFILLSDFTRNKLSFKDCAQQLLLILSNMFYARVGCLHFLVSINEKLAFQTTWHIEDTLEKIINQSAYTVEDISQLNKVAQQCYHSKTTIIDDNIEQESVVQSINSALTTPVHKLLAFPILENKQVIAIFELFINVKSENMEQNIVIANSVLMQFSTILERIKHEMHLQEKYSALSNTFDKLSQLHNPNQKKNSHDTSQNLEELEENYKKMLDEINFLATSLTDTQERLSSIVNTMPSIIFSSDANGKIIDWNSSASEVTKINSEQAKNKHMMEIIPIFYKQHESNIKAVLKNNTTYREEKVPNLLAPEDIEDLYFNLSIYPVQNASYSGIVVKMDDISDSIKMEDVMRINEKKISLGGLASGISHELINPLNSIKTNIQMINKRLDPVAKINIEHAEKYNIDLNKLAEFKKERKIDDFLSGADYSCDRAIYIASNLLEYSRRQKTSNQKQKIKVILDSTIHLINLDLSLRKKITDKNLNISLDEVDESLDVYCNKIELEQVFLNIVKNAIQALCDTKKQDLYIKISTKQQEKYVNITICDNGPGMSQETQDNIFNPFFTTKESGSGTGLGLSVVKGIVETNHQGKIEVTSELGVGTSFIISIPIEEFSES